MKITVSTIVDAPMQRVWQAWTTPAHIVRWNFASADWQCPAAEIDLVEGGRFSYRMEARDGSMGFDFEGEFIEIVPQQLIEYRLGDGRVVRVEFSESDDGATLTETFEAEDELSGEHQKQGWQAILDNFKRHVETLDA